MLPIIISAPHAQSEIIDEEIRSRIALTDYEIWKCSDPYTGDLDHFTCAEFKHVATTHRLICDFNRKPDTDSAFHTIDFFGRTVFKEGQEYTHDEKQHFIDEYWYPYHQEVLESVKILDSQGHRVILIVDYHNTSGDHPLSKHHEYMPSIVLSNLGSPNSGYKTKEQKTSLPPKYLRFLKERIKQKLAVGAEINTVFKGGFNTVWFNRLNDRSDIKAKIYAVQVEYNLDHIYNPFSKKFDRKAFQIMQKGLNSAIEELFEVLE